MFWLKNKSDMPSAEEALAGRDRAVPVPETHFVIGRPLKPPFPEGLETVVFGLGCFWGAEKLFWQTPGVYTTAVGYAGGFTPNPTYEEVCSGRTGHAEVVLVVFDPKVVTYEEVCSAGTGHTEVVRVVYDPKRISYAQLLQIFWENHDPTQGMRQGNDVGTQYRSAIYTTTPAQAAAAEASQKQYASALGDAGYGAVTTEIREAPEFYYAEDYHQQYLAKNPNGYCPDHGTGVSCPIGVAAAE